MNTLARMALVFTGIAILSGESCGPEVIKNPGFDLWCGDALCTWELHKGRVERVPTWHARDYGVSMVGDEVVISQVSQEGFECLVFETLADIDESATVYLEVDLLDDGSVEFSQQIAGAAFKPVLVQLRAPAWHPSARFTLHKRGGGRAVLAQIAADRADQCTLPVTPLTNLANGARCSDGAECRGGSCVLGWPVDTTEKACGPCESDTACTGGQVCGAEPSERYEAFRACVDKGRDELGEQCITGAECASGVCCNGLCAECCTSAAAPSACAGGAQCQIRSAPADDVSNGAISPPFGWGTYQCAPGAADRARGAACLHDADCASGKCRGGGRVRYCTATLRVCTGSEDCPQGCADFGARDGLCD